MDEKQREETIKIFTEAFHEVVVPILEELKQDFKEVVSNTERIERKLDQITDSHARALDKHTKQIANLEGEKVLS